MPIYEYACRGCGTGFELLIRGQETPRCPACQGADLERALSTFAVGSAAQPRRSPKGEGGPCGQCGDPRGLGACSMN